MIASYLTNCLRSNHKHFCFMEESIKKTRYIKIDMYTYIFSNKFQFGTSSILWCVTEHIFSSRLYESN